MGSMERESRVAAVAAIMLMAAASALSKEKLKRASPPPAAEKLARMRRIVISIPDRKLALLEGNLIVKIWATAVGAEAAPRTDDTDQTHPMDRLRCGGDRDLARDCLELLGFHPRDAAGRREPAVAPAGGQTRDHLD